MKDSKQGRLVANPRLNHVLGAVINIPTRPFLSQKMTFNVFQPDSVFILSLLSDYLAGTVGTMEFATAIESIRPKATSKGVPAPEL